MMTAALQATHASHIHASHWALRRQSFGRQELGEYDRRVYVCDSYLGLPPPRLKEVHRPHTRTNSPEPILNRFRPPRTKPPTGTGTSTASCGSQSRRYRTTSGATAWWTTVMEPKTSTSSKANHQPVRESPFLSLLLTLGMTLQGWFNETMPQAATTIDEIAVLRRCRHIVPDFRTPTPDILLKRLDGDMFESTMDVLTHMYPKANAQPNLSRRAL